MHPLPRARVLGGEELHFYWAEEDAVFNLGGISGREKDDQ